MTPAVILWKMSSLNWKLLLGTLVVAAGATGAYIYLTNSQRTGYAEADASNDASDEKKAAAPRNPKAEARRRKKEKQKAAVASATNEALGAASSASSHDSIVSEINTATVNIEKSMSELATLCEKDSDELQNLSVDDKQKVFYALLMKGEVLMNQGILLHNCLIR